MRAGTASDVDSTQRSLPARPPSMCLSGGPSSPLPEGAVPSGVRLIDAEVHRAGSQTPGPSSGSGLAPGLSSSAHPVTHQPASAPVGFFFYQKWPTQD